MGSAALSDCASCRHTYTIPDPSRMYVYSLLFEISYYTYIISIMYLVQGSVPRWLIPKIAPPKPQTLSYIFCEGISDPPTTVKGLLTGYFLGLAGILVFCGVDHFGTYPYPYHPPLIPYIRQASPPPSLHLLHHSSLVHGHLSKTSSSQMNQMNQTSSSQMKMKMNQPLTPSRNRFNEPRGVSFPFP